MAQRRIHGCQGDIHCPKCRQCIRAPPGALDFPAGGRSLRHGPLAFPAVARFISHEPLAFAADGRSLRHAALVIILSFTAPAGIPLSLFSSTPISEQPAVRNHALISRVLGQHGGRVRIGGWFFGESSPYLKAFFSTCAFVKIVSIIQSKTRGSGHSLGTGRPSAALGLTPQCTWRSSAVWMSAPPLGLRAVAAWAGNCPLLRPL